MSFLKRDVISKTCYKFYRHKISLKNERYSSTVSKEDDTSHESVRMKKQPPPLVKKPAKPPFMKNVFQSVFDTDVLTYPEFLGEMRVANLDVNTEIVKGLMKEHVDSEKIDKTGEIPDTILGYLRQLRLFGQQTPTKYGGLGYTTTESARIYEALSEDASVAAALFAHETLGGRVLELYGNESQKERYARKLASGEWWAAFCAGERDCGTDVTSFNTIAVKEGANWILNGSKVWVMNADIANFFIVVARVRRLVVEKVNVYYDVKGGEILVPDDICFMIVEKSSEGVSIGPRIDTIGLRGVHMCDVNFENVLVPEANLLGDLGSGYEMFSQLVCLDRHLIGSIALTGLRRLIGDVTRYSIERKLYNQRLCDYDITRAKITRAVMNAYAIESMIYMTCGLRDEYEKPQTDVESAITKVFATDAYAEATSALLSVLGGDSARTDKPYERYARDARMLQMYDVDNEVLRLYIALTGLKYVSDDMSSEIMITRNPYSFPRETIKRIFTKFRVDSEDPVLRLKLNHYLHPSVKGLADILETCVLRFGFGVERAFTRHGTEIVDDQMMMKRMADCAILIYMMTCTLGRASRSYCIGCFNTDDELVLAEMIVRESEIKFVKLLEGLIEGPTYTTDDVSRKIADKAIHSKGYFSEHPLKLTY